MRIPISIKLIVITVVLLIGVTIPVTMKTSEITSAKLVEFQQDNNLALAMGKARELNQLFNNLKDKVTLNGRLLQSWKEGNTADLNYQKDFEANFNLDSALLGIEVYKYESSGEVAIGNSYKKPFDTRVAEYRKRSPFDRNEIKEGNMVILNSSVETWEPIVTIALPLIKINKTITHYVVADIDLSLIQKTMSDAGLNLFFVTDKTGIVMGHRDESLATKKQNFSGNEIVRFALQSSMASGMKYLPVSANQKAMYAAYAKTTFGPIVFSQVEEEKILVVTKELKNNIIQIVGYFLSVTLFLVFVFSMTLTSPLETLTNLIHLVSKEIGRAHV